MNITCDNCSNVMTLSEDEVRKIPPGKQASVVCPKCERKFSIGFGKTDEKMKGTAKAKAPTPSDEETQALEKEIKGSKKESSADAAEDLFGFIEDEGPAKASEAKAGTSGGAASKKDTVDDMIGSDLYDASDKPFDFVEEEGKTALVCETDQKLKGPIVENLHLM